MIEDVWPATENYAAPTRRVRLIVRVHEPIQGTVNQKGGRITVTLRRVFGLVLAIGLVVSGACGGDDDDDSASPADGKESGKTTETRLAELLVAPEGLTFEENQEIQQEIESRIKKLGNGAIDLDVTVRNLMTEEGSAGLLSVILFDPQEKKRAKTIQGIIKGYEDETDGDISSATVAGEEVDFVESEEVTSMFWKGSDFLVIATTADREEAEAFGDLYFETIRR